MNSHADAKRAGLCASCRHAHEQTHPRGGPSYWRCALAAADPRFPRYPRLPVLQCPGHAHGEPRNEKN